MATTKKKANGRKPKTIANAVVRASFLGRAQGAKCRTAFVRLQIGESAQGAFGGLPMYPDGEQEIEKRRDRIEFIFELLDTVGVISWEQLPGTPCRVEIDENGRVVAIGHYVGDKWLRV